MDAVRRRRQGGPRTVTITEKPPSSTQVMVWRGGAAVASTLVTCHGPTAPVAPALRAVVLPCQSAWTWKMLPQTAGAKRQVEGVTWYTQPEPRVMVGAPGRAI